MKRLAYLFFINLIMMFSCEFVPDEVPETILQPPLLAPPLEFSLDNYEDTIKIGWPADFSYTIDSEGRKILSVKISLGEQILTNYVKGMNTQRVNFTIDPKQFNDGTYTMHVEIITGTGSGSLAEAIDGEGFMYVLDKPVLIDKTLPEYESCLLKAVHVQDAINLSWSAFNHPNFISYSIYRSTYAHTEPVQIATLTDPSIAFFTDTTYWEGERNTYYLKINTPAGSYIGNQIEVNDTLTGMEVHWNKDGQILVRWDKAKNIESLGGYYIYSFFGGNSVLEKYFISDPEQDSVKLTKSGFAYGLTIRLKFIPAGLSESRYSNIIGTQIRFYPQPSLPKHQRSYIVNSKDFILLAAEGRLYKYYPLELSVTDSIITKLPTIEKLSVSNNGDMFAYTDFTDIYLRRTDNFSIVTRFPAPSLLNQAGYDKLVLFNLSNDGRLVVGDSDGMIFLFDALSGALLNRDTIQVNGKGMVRGTLSPDGTRLILCHQAWPYPKVTAYEQGMNRWQEISSIQSYNYPFFFWSASGSSLIMAAMDRVEKRRSDLELISGFNAAYTFWESVDPESETILFEKDDFLIFYDINTGLIEKKIEAGSVGIVQRYKNFLIDTYGLQITLPD
ncbi:MAG TPA: hypothetical protein VHO46_12715 [Bacteroidales bacterium]|nr:hypothetical protein [Bacteroidales bacterium]